MSRRSPPTRQRIHIEVLGSGTSVGVPTIGCPCDVCRSEDPRDKRLRPSLLLRWRDPEGEWRNVLIDCGPDFRQQALRSRMDRLDAILFTHAHADHIMGLDDVRPFNFRQRSTIPIYGSRETVATIRQIFRYIFETLYTQSTIPKLETHVFPDGPFSLFGVEVTPVPVRHGAHLVHGFRFGSAAYLTDHNVIPEESLPLLAGLDVLFVDGLRHRDHPTHSTVKQALSHIERLRPRRAYLTHISHDLGHEETERTLPSHVALSFDQLALEVSARPPARVFRHLDELGLFFGPCVLTIGNFDGVHLGHQELLRRVAEAARELGVKAAALTFDPHPARVVAPERAPRLLTPIEERTQLMADYGIEQVLVLPFDRAIASLSPEEFVDRILVARLGVQRIVVGEDFRFGARQAGDVHRLAELGRSRGFTVEAVAKLSRHRRQISSSRIRELLLAGAVHQAAQALGRPYTLTGEVVRGHGIGSTHTVPTLNLAWTAEILPARGVYVTETADFHSTRRWPSITNVGYRPTFDGRELSVETFLLEPPIAPPPRRIAVSFCHRLRDERKFEDSGALRHQILRDVERAKVYHRRRQRWALAAARATPRQGNQDPVDTIKPL